MHLKDFALHFEKLSKQSQLSYSLAQPASETEILQAEQVLGVMFPEQVTLFYKNFNGLSAENPSLEVLPIERISFAFPNLLHFATLGDERRLYFDTSHLNEADQWDIVTEDGYRVTMTMASFWSNKIWAWIEKKRAIWEDERTT